MWCDEERVDWKRKMQGGWDFSFIGFVNFLSKKREEYRFDHQDNGFDSILRMELGIILILIKFYY